MKLNQDEKLLLITAIDMCRRNLSIYVAGRVSKTQANGLKSLIVLRDRIEKDLNKKNKGEYNHG